MQVIAPDFYASFSGAASTKPETQGNGYFDTLLRDEEARYHENAQTRRDRPEAVRPVLDDRSRSEFRHEEPVSERPDADYDTADEPRDIAAEEEAPRMEQAAEEQPAPEREEPDLAEAARESEPAAARQEPIDENQPEEAQADPTGRSQAAASSDLQGQAAVAAQSGPGSATAAKAQATGLATSSAATPVATAPAEATSGAALPASAAAAAQKAAGKTTDKAANTTAADVRPSSAEASRAQPTAAAANQRPAGEATQDIVVEAVEGLNARPTASLGGGAATAAMAQKSDATAAGKGNSQMGQTGNGTDSQAKAAAVQATPNAKASDTSLAAAAKAQQPQATQPTASSGSSDGAGLSNNQSPTSLPGAAAAGSAPIQNTSFAETLATARPIPTGDPAEQIAVQVRRAQVAGQEQINIKLHPAELGRIEVKLESNNDGTLRAVISAERSETLDLLQRDSRGLERALQDAGVKTDSGSLSFNLRGQGQNQGQMAQEHGAPGQGGRSANGGAQAEAEPAAPPQHRGSHHNGALDIQV